METPTEVPEPAFFRGRAPVRIRAMIVVYTPEGCAVFDADAGHLPLSPPFFWVAIQPAKGGGDIAELRAVYDAGARGRFEEVLAGEVEVGAAGRFVRRRAAESGGFTPREGETLADRLAALTAEMGDAEIREHLARLRDTGPAASPAHAEQRVADLFVAGLATYLGLVAVMEHPAFWDLLPVHWTLGLHARGGNLLNQNALNYFGLPMHAVSRLAVGLERAVADGVVSFVNTWGHVFGRGPELESQRLVLEVVSGCAGAAVDKLADLSAARQTLVDDLSLAAEAELARLTLELKCRLGDAYATFLGKAGAEFAAACREALPAQTAELAARVDASLDRVYPRLRDELQAALWAEFACAIGAARDAAAAQEKRIQELEARLAKVESRVSHEPASPPDPCCPPRPRCAALAPDAPAPSPSEVPAGYSREWGAKARAARPGP